MNEQEIIPKITEINKEDSYTLLSELHKFPDATQRQLSLRLNMSLGKTNYILRQSITKGLIKMKNFSHNPGKLKKIKYILTPKGMKEKLSLTYYFLKRKEAEYNSIKNEWNVLTNQKQAEKQTWVESRTG